MKRLGICLLLVSCMLVSMLPMDALAASVNGVATVTASQQETQNPFTDVSKTEWFYDAVMYAKQSGIFSGMIQTVS